MNNSSNSIKEIEQAFKVPVTVHEAFDIFTKELNSWWPKEYTWAGDALESIEIVPCKNGRCFERGPHGFECDWGRVLIWDPPNRIMFTWQIDPNRSPQPNPEKVSEIEVLFEQKDGNETQITFIHRNFEKHGNNAQSYREALSSPQGWPYILNNFKEAVS